MLTFAPLRTLKVLVVLSALALIAPRPAQAGDCAADYLLCLSDYGDFSSSTIIHEEECWGGYVYCLGRTIRML